MDKNDKKYNFVFSQNAFASRIRRSLIYELPRIPREIHEFLRPMEMRLDLNLSHNWGDFILYPDKTIFRIYGNGMDPNVFPRDVPLKIGFLEIMRQLGASQIVHLPDSARKGSFFPEWIEFVDYVLVKGAWKQIVHLLESYKFMTMCLRNHDPEGFITKLKIDKKMANFVHVFHYPKDIIRNVISFEEKDERKDKYLAYRKMVEAKWKKDPQYDPFPNILGEFSKVMHVMDFF